MEHTPIAPDTDLARLTRQYARYSLSAGGLGSALGGALTLIAYFAGALAPPQGVAGRVALALVPAVWIAAKELLRSRYYQRFGRVVEVRTKADRRWHLGFTLFTAAVSAGIATVVVAALVSGRAEPGAGTAGYLAWVLAMPVLVWFFMRTPLEFIVGVFLMAQAALALVGRHYGLGDQPQAPIAALVLIGIGIRQHVEFRRIERELVRRGAV